MTTEVSPSWLKMKPLEVEKIVLDLGKEGKTPQEIGTILRDQHGIPKTKQFGKRISKILKENNVKIVPERELLNKKINILKEHFKKNKHDYSASKSLTKKLWALNRLERKGNL